jgi:hypothetical protein
MHSDKYHRLYATCLTMAAQADSPDVRARWLALAKDCENLLGGCGAKGRQSKLLATRIRARLRDAGMEGAGNFTEVIEPLVIEDGGTPTKNPA